MKGFEIFGESYDRDEINNAVNSYWLWRKRGCEVPAGNAQEFFSKFLPDYLSTEIDLGDFDSFLKSCPKEDWEEAYKIIHRIQGGKK